ETVSLLSEKALEVHAYPGPDNVTVIFRDVSERIKMQNALRESEQRVRLKLDSILTPEGDIGSLELADIIDVQAIQSLMDELCTLVPIPMAILDMKGRVLVAKGWQDICTKFHRVHPETCAHCVESDLVLSAGVPPGESRLYKCKNNMWDIATPILIGGHQMGNLFAGQFFFEEESVDYEVFRSQARLYGFDEEEYVAALDAVPRLARQTVERAIAFLMKLSHMISQLSYSNVKLARSMSQSEALAESLRESEERHRSLFQNLLDAYCYCQMVFDGDGRPVDYVFLEVNEAFAAMSGYEDVVGKKATEVIPGVREAHPEMFEAYGRVAMTGQPERFEIHFTPTGRWFTVQAHSVRKGYVAIIFENITERKRSQSRIAALARLYAVLSRVNETIVRVRDEQSLFDGVCGIVAEVGGFPLVWIGLAKDGWVVPVASCGEDSGYLRDIRIRVEGDLGRGPTGTCIRENRAVINDDFETNPSTLPWREQALTHGFHASAAFPVRRRGKAVGAFTLYAFEPNTFDSEQVSLLESLSADISYALDAMDQERLRGETEEALRENQARLETVFAAIPDVILEYDTDGMPVRANEAALRAVGLTSLSFTRDKAVAKLKFRNLDAGAVTTDDLPTSRALRGETVAGDLYTIETADGVDRIVSTYAVPLYKEGSVNGVVALWHDVSELKRSEEALRRAHDELEKRVQERTAELQQAYDKLVKEEGERRQLEEQLRQAQKMEALGTLTGGIAHDFNNILAAMIGFTEIVRDHAPEESREKHHLERVLEAGLRGRELIKRMLAFSRKTEQEKKRILLSTVVKETMKFVRSSTPSTISIRVSANGESRMVFADPVQMQQVVLNLCTNAIQAMQEKGGLLEVELSERTVSESDGGPHGMKPGPYVELVVRDTGKGISRDIIDRIFDPFFTTKKVGEGTGLGLSVVHGIVHQHEGHISVESEEGKGSTFTVSLPAVEAALPEKGVAEQSAPMGCERILFVDDEELLAEMGKEILEDLGYEVIATTSSAEALALFKSEPGRFDLVITDVTMPEITGVELAREILSLRPDMPIIMCTGFSHLVNPDTAKAAGIKAFAMKPLTKREIARTIRHVLGE
ncbi:MAG: PocR ligand-binding domain-containing protein, partial [Syntrophorhabdales bacterium]